MFSFSEWIQKERKENPWLTKEKIRKGTILRRNFFMLIFVGKYTTFSSPQKMQFVSIKNANNLCCNTYTEIMHWLKGKPFLRQHNLRKYKLTKKYIILKLIRTLMKWVTKSLLGRVCKEVRVKRSKMPRKIV